MGTRRKPRGNMYEVTPPARAKCLAQTQKPPNPNWQVIWLGPSNQLPDLRKRKPIDGSAQGAKHLAATPDCQLPHPNCSRECACKVGRCVPPERVPPDTTHQSVCREAHNNKTTESLSNVRKHSKTKLCATNVTFGRPHAETMSACHYVAALSRKPCREALVRVRPSA